MANVAMLKRTPWDVSHVHGRRKAQLTGGLLQSGPQPALRGGPPACVKGRAVLKAASGRALGDKGPS